MNTVYKPYLISTVVDAATLTQASRVYKPYLISTIVDGIGRTSTKKFINLI